MPSYIRGLALAHTPTYVRTSKGLDGAVRHRTDLKRFATPHPPRMYLRHYCRRPPQRLCARLYVQNIKYVKPTYLANTLDPSALTPHLTSPLNTHLNITDSIRQDTTLAHRPYLPERYIPEAPAEPETPTVSGTGVWTPAVPKHWRKRLSEH